MIRVTTIRTTSKVAADMVTAEELSPVAFVVVAREAVPVDTAALADIRRVDKAEASARSKTLMLLSIAVISASKNVVWRSSKVSTDRPEHQMVFTRISSAIRNF
jgi:hypothetical protein